MHDLSSLDVRRFAMAMRGSSSFYATIAVVALACSVSSTGAQRVSHDWDGERRRMVDAQLKARDIHDARVLDAMRSVPRHLFVPKLWRAESYADSPLPIGHGQTISKPYIVAYMTQALHVEPGDRVLEIGTGSGYQAAVLGELAKEVYSIEIVPPLAERARETLKSLGYRNIQVRTGNGYLGWPEHAPYDRIMVTAAPEEVPTALVSQLKIGGVMAIPVGTLNQELQILRRTATGTETLGTLPVRFVPMTGKPSRPAPAPAAPPRPELRRKVSPCPYVTPPRPNVPWDGVQRTQDSSDLHRARLVAGVTAGLLARSLGVGQPRDERTLASDKPAGDSTAK